MSAKAGLIIIYSPWAIHAWHIMWTCVLNVEIQMKFFLPSALKGACNFYRPVYAKPSVAC